MRAFGTSKIDLPPLLYPCTGWSVGSLGSHTIFKLNLLIVSNNENYTNVGEVESHIIIVKVQN